MFNKFSRALKKIHRNQKGITGLETAIILIAFVTVASVLAYAVLSAGIFSAERGKETVYEGLAHAKATMETRGAVIGASTNGTAVSSVKFQLACVLPGEQVDLTLPPNNVTVIKYIDDEVNQQVADWTKTLLSVERGSTDVLEDDEVIEITVPVPAGTTLSAYEQFRIEIIPPKGATVTIARTTPASLSTIFNMN